MEEGFFNDLMNDVMDGKVTETEAFMLTSQIFTETDELIKEYGKTEVREIKKCCAEVWKTLLPACSSELENKAFDVFSGWMREGALREIEEAEKIWMKFFKEESFVERKLQIIEEKAETCDDEKQLDLWIARRISLAEQYGSALEITAAFEKKYWSRPQVRQHVIRRMIESGDLGKAFELLKESREMDAGDRKLVEWYCRQIVKISRTMGVEIYRRELYDVLTVHLPCDILSFRCLKRTCGSGEWHRMRKVIFERMGHMAGKAELYAEEGMLNELMEYLKNYGTLEEMMRFEKILGKKYAVDILKTYERVFDEMIGNASKRNHYRNIIKQMHRMKKYPGGEIRMYALVGRWRKKYGRKNALLVELSKL